MKARRIVLASTLALVAAGAFAVAAATAAPPLGGAERTTLLSLREEEKLAHDVYVALAKTSGNQAFLRIAAAETRHGRALQRALATYGIADPTDGLGDGVFATARFQRLYDDLVARGSVSAAAAYGVGVTIEKDDVAALTSAIAETDEAVLKRVYASLRSGSQRHLAAFERQLTPASAACERDGPGPRRAR